MPTPRPPVHRGMPTPSSCCPPSPSWGVVGLPCRPAAAVAVAAVAGVHAAADAGATGSEPSRYVTGSAVRRHQCLVRPPYGVGRRGTLVTDRFYDVRGQCGTAA